MSPWEGETGETPVSPGPLAQVGTLVNYQDTVTLLTLRRTRGPTRPLAGPPSPEQVESPTRHRCRINRPSTP